MKVILKADVKGQGKKGELVEVSEGYGRNFLLPRGLAELATADSINLMKQADAAKARRIELDKQAARETAEKLMAVKVLVRAKAGQGGRLFGAVTAKEISEALKAQHNIEIDKHKVMLGEAIKAFGTYTVKAKLYPEITGDINVQVIEA
ncbi:50S ribosomal protein L9 [Intestinibacillus massiliensis]|uniref:50S ribosomal protein L9 n=1 Tax=Intestinibacillus massiliensis TaxID=1871029 RepID=UPI000B350FB2|nr:50S ribosomal protein L9 [Intestinibacillus massiliensis]MCB6366394.1 50S ribosomal protein L9 [Intestinibacillus massiliensis]